VLLILITKPMGLFLTNVFNGERNWLTPLFGPVERLFYKIVWSRRFKRAEVVGICHCHAAL